MASKAAGDQPFGQCRCCLGVGYHKDITQYRQMFLDCFNLRLSTNPALINKICMFCISRLNDAQEFRALVAESERHLLVLSSIKATANYDFINVAQHDEGDIQEEEAKKHDGDNVTVKQEDDNDCVITENEREKRKRDDDNDCVITENEREKRKRDDDNDCVFTENERKKRKRFFIFEEEINDTVTMDDDCNEEREGDNIESIKEENDDDCNEEKQDGSNVTDAMDHDDDSNTEREEENIAPSKDDDNNGNAQTETADNDVCNNDENEIMNVPSTATQTIKSQSSSSSLPPTNNRTLKNRTLKRLETAGDMVLLSHSKRTNKNTLSRSITMKINKTKGIINKTTSESFDAESNESQANLTQDKPGSSSSGLPSSPTTEITLKNRTTKRLETAGDTVLLPSKRTNKSTLSKSITMKISNKTKTEVNKTTSESFDAKSNESQTNLTQDKPGSSLGSPSPPTNELTLRNRTTNRLETSGDMVLLSPSNKNTQSKSITMKVNNKTKETEVNKTTSESFDLKSHESQANLTQDKPGSSSSGSTSPPINELTLRNRTTKRLETSGDMILLSPSNKNTQSKSITMKVNNKTKETEVNRTTSESFDLKSNESQANLTQDKPGSSSSGSHSEPYKELTLRNRTTKRLATAGDMVLLSPSKRTNKDTLSISITAKVNTKTKETEVNKTTCESFDAKSNESQANLTQDKPGSSSSGKGKYTCNLCKFKTYKKDYLETHLKVHSTYENSATKYYVCDTCSFTTYTRNLIISHISKHTKQTFACLICNRKLKDRGALDRHVRTHTGEKPFACEYCDKNFITSSALNTHVRMHTGEKPYACDVCDKKFTFQCNLNEHVRIHTGEKPYACKMCDSKFKTISQLKNHNLTHTDEKTYECEICEKKFKGYSHLHQHVKRHKDEKAGGKLAKKVKNKKNAKKKSSS